MSEIERQAAQEEALNTVASRPPTVGESRVQSAMHRYLGSSMWEVLRHQTGTTPPKDTDGEHPRPDTKT